MANQNIIFLSIPALRPGDITKESAPTLHAWANSGALATLTPTFPCVTSPVQASMWTGVGSGQHGVIANGFYHRDRREVEFWVARNGIIEGRQIWDDLADRGIESAVWHAQNIKDCAANHIVTPAPTHEDDGTTKLWCYSKPDGLYQELLADLGHFPLQHYWGPLSNIESTRWILRGAEWLIKRHAPRFHWIYIPHLDYASQKHGPNSDQAKAAIAELDAELTSFAGAVAESPSGADVTFVVAGEYAMTDVSGVAYPNRVLREAGLLHIDECDGAELLVPGKSQAFAMVDHQLAHVFVNAEDQSRRREVTDRVVELFRGAPGITAAYSGAARSELGMTHKHAGDVVLVAGDNHWFSYYWWIDDAAAPQFARTVDIHRKPGYDPVELFFDPATRSIPLDASLVKGSHGAPATSDHHKTALICSSATKIIQAGEHYRDTDMRKICLSLLM